MFLYCHISEYTVVNHGKGRFGRTLIYFCLGLGLIAAKTMSEALVFNPKAVLGYAIDNNLLEAHGWRRVRVLAQNTSDDKMLAKIRRRVGQLEKAARERMEPKLKVGVKGEVPVQSE